MSKRKSRLAQRKPVGSMGRLAMDISKYGLHDRGELRTARNVSDLMRDGKSVSKAIAKGLCAICQKVPSTGQNKCDKCRESSQTMPETASIEYVVQYFSLGAWGVLATYTYMPSAVHLARQARRNGDRIRIVKVTREVVDQ